MVQGGDDTVHKQAILSVNGAIMKYYNINSLISCHIITHKSSGHLAQTSKKCHGQLEFILVTSPAAEQSAELLKAISDCCPTLPGLRRYFCQTQIKMESAQTYLFYILKCHFSPFICGLIS